MKQTIKIWGLTIAGFTFLAVVIYSGFWFYLASKIETVVTDFVVEAKEDDIHIVTRALSVENFPFTPEVNFSGRISIEGNVIEVPLLLVRSTFIPDRPISIETPQGLSILEPADTALWSVDSMLIDSVIPANLPGELVHEDLSIWKDAGGKIELQNIELQKDTLKLKGTGTFMLDDALQPAGTFTARIKGHMEFLQWLRRKRYVETKEALLSSAVLSGLSKTEGNETYMDVGLTIQNQTLFVGPLRLAYLPSIQWAWRSAPDQLQ